MNLLIELSLEGKSISDHELEECALDEEVLCLLLQLRICDEGRIMTAIDLTGSPVLLQLSHVSGDFLDHIDLDLAEELRGLSRSLGGHHEGAYQVVDSLGLGIFLLLAHIEGLIHEIGQVCDGWNRVTVEAVYHNLLNKATEWAFEMNLVQLSFAIGELVLD